MNQPIDLPITALIGNVWTEMQALQIQYQEFEHLEGGNPTIEERVTRSTVAQVLRVLDATTRLEFRLDEDLDNDSEQVGLDLDRTRRPLERLYQSHAETRQGPQSKTLGRLGDHITAYTSMKMAGQNEFKASMPELPLANPDELTDNEANTVANVIMAAQLTRFQAATLVVPMLYLDGQVPSPENYKLVDLTAIGEKVSNELARRDKDPFSDVSRDPQAPIEIRDMANEALGAIDDKLLYLYTVARNLLRAPSNLSFGSIFTPQDVQDTCVANLIPAQETGESVSRGGVAGGGGASMTKLYLAMDYQRG